MVITADQQKQWGVPNIDQRDEKMKNCKLKLKLSNIFKMAKNVRIVKNGQHCQKILKNVNNCQNCLKNNCSKIVNLLKWPNMVKNC